MKVYFFGVERPKSSGHYIYGTPSCHQEYIGLISVRALDGLIRPGPQSQATLCVLGNWTVLTMSDYTGDSRPGSNSAFIAEGVHSFERMKELAKLYWPAQYARITEAAEIVLL